MSNEKIGADSRIAQRELTEASTAISEDLSAELSRARSELNAESRLTRNELKEELSRTRMELYAELSKTREELNTGLAVTRKELSKESSKLTRKDWLKIVVVPLAFIVVAALLGTYFQDRSFTKNTLFQTKYERLLTAQKETAAQYQDLNSLLNTLKRWEELSRGNQTYCSADYFNPLIEQLKQFDNRSLALKDYSKESGADSVLDTALNEYSQKIKDTVKCESNYVLSGCKAPCDQSVTELRAALQNTIYKHNDLINDLIRQSR
jgi:hypothetical protein